LHTKPPCTGSCRNLGRAGSEGREGAVTSTHHHCPALVSEAPWGGSLSPLNSPLRCQGCPSSLHASLPPGWSRSLVHCLRRLLSSDPLEGTLARWPQLWLPSVPQKAGCPLGRVGGAEPTFAGCSPPPLNFSVRVGRGGRPPAWFPLSRGLVHHLWGQKTLGSIIVG
jgi:hypothetical protein